MYVYICFFLSLSFNMDFFWNKTFLVAYVTFVALKLIVNGASVTNDFFLYIERTAHNDDDSREFFSFLDTT